MYFQKSTNIGLPYGITIKNLVPVWKDHVIVLASCDGQPEVDTPYYKSSGPRISKSALFMVPDHFGLYCPLSRSPHQYLAGFQNYEYDHALTVLRRVTSSTSDTSDQRLARRELILVEYKPIQITRKIQWMDVNVVKGLNANYERHKFLADSHVDVKADRSELEAWKEVQFMIFDDLF